LDFIEKKYESAAFAEVMLYLFVEYVKREKYLAVIWSVSSRPICLIAVVELSWLWQFLVFTYTLLVCQVL